MSEKYDFSKIEDQQKFDEQSEEKREEYIEKSHEEALKIEDNIQKVEKTGLSLEETRIAKELAIKGKNVGESINSAQIETRLLDIEKAFANKKIEEITRNDVKKLKEKIEEMIGFFSGKTIHFDIEISPAEQFFSFINSRVHSNLFTDKKTLELVSRNITNVFLDIESKRGFAFENLVEGKIVYKPNDTHIAQKKREAAHFLESLNLFEDAYGLYSTSAYEVYGGGVDRATSEITNLLENYVKSGQKSEKLDNIIRFKTRKISDIEFNGELRPEERDIYGHKTREERIELFSVIKTIKSAMETLKKIGLPESQLKDEIRKICIRGAEELFERATDKYGTGEYKNVDAYEVYHGSLNMYDNLKRYVDGIIEISKLTGDKSFIEKAYNQDLDKIFEGIVASHRDDKYFYESTKKYIKDSIESYKKMMEEKINE